MKTRNSALCALGLAAAITLGGAVTASAQDTTRARSQTRIPVRKDQPAPRRPGGYRHGHAHGHRGPDADRHGHGHARRHGDADRGAAAAAASWLAVRLGVGMDIPPRETGVTSSKMGWTCHAHLGWFPGTSPVGIRLDGDYTNSARDELAARTAARRSLWQLSVTSSGASRSIGRARSIRRSTSSAAAASIGSRISFRIAPAATTRTIVTAGEQDGHDGSPAPGRGGAATVSIADGHWQRRRRNSARRILHRVAVQEHQHGRGTPRTYRSSSAGTGTSSSVRCTLSSACRMLYMMRTAEDVNFTSSAV